MKIKISRLLNCITENIKMFEFHQLTICYVMLDPNLTSRHSVFQTSPSWQVTSNMHSTCLITLLYKLLRPNRLHPTYLVTLIYKLFCPNRLHPTYLITSLYKLLRPNRTSNIPRHFVLQTSPSLTYRFWCSPGVWDWTRSIQKVRVRDG